MTPKRLWFRYVVVVYLKKIKVKIYLAHLLHVLEINFPSYSEACSIT